MHICHCTSVHLRNDTRILHKMCRSLVKDGHQVTLIVSDGLGNENFHGVIIIDIGLKLTRAKRVIKTSSAVLEKAKNIDADIYHLHDPELLLYAKKLKSSRGKVVFDYHEEFRKQLLAKHYLPGFTGKLLSTIYTSISDNLHKNIDGFISATKHIHEATNTQGKPHEIIFNYSIMDELTPPSSVQKTKNNALYLGSITQFRGIYELIQAMELVEGSLTLIGSFKSPTFKAKVEQLNGWKKVNELGPKNRTDVAIEFGKTNVGICTLSPSPNHLESIPTKMFEYMSAGLPVILSNFPLWKQMVESENCALFVDPENPKEIAEALNWIFNNPKEAQLMGERGKQLVLNNYNWENEYNKLISYYKKVAEQQ